MSVKLSQVQIKFRPVFCAESVVGVSVTHLGSCAVHDLKLSTDNRDILNPAMASSLLLGPDVYV